MQRTDSSILPLKRFVAGGIVLVLALSIVAPARGQVAIIANESVSVQEIDSETLFDIFSLEESKWPDGSPIVPVDFKGKNEFKQAFYKYLGRPSESVKRDRLRIILAGEGAPPLVTNSSEETLEMVAKTQGAIGYIPIDLALPKGVHIVATISN